MAEPKRILVVDDEVDMVATLRDILVTAGYEVDVASSGQQALDRCHAGVTACVLMDVVMPELDGLATLREMKRLAPDVRVLFMTASVTSELVHRAKEAGVRKVLPKPLDFEQLLRWLGQAASG